MEILYYKLHNEGYYPDRINHVYRVLTKMLVPDHSTHNNLFTGIPCITVF